MYTSSCQWYYIATWLVKYFPLGGNGWIKKRAIARKETSVKADGRYSSACHLLSRGFFTRLILRPWRRRRYVSPERRLTFKGLHGVISQKTVIFRLLSVPTTFFSIHLSYPRRKITVTQMYVKEIINHSMPSLPLLPCISSAGNEASQDKSKNNHPLSVLSWV
jgi:hypothetical protein